MRAGNTLDTLVEEGGKAHVRHHLLDFGATLGSATLKARPLLGRAGLHVRGRPGGEERADARHGGSRMAPGPVLRVARRSAGCPRSTRPSTRRRGSPGSPTRRSSGPDPTTCSGRPGVLRLSRTRRSGPWSRGAEYRDERDAEFITRTLIKRRDAIARAYLPASTRWSARALGGRHACRSPTPPSPRASQTPASGYRADWAVFDNATAAVDLDRGDVRRRARTSAVASGCPQERGAIVRVDDSGRPGAPVAWTLPVHAYFRKTGGRNMEAGGIRATTVAPHRAVRIV